MQAFEQQILKLSAADPVVGSVFVLLGLMSCLSWLVGFWKLGSWLLEQFYLRRFLRRQGRQFGGTLPPASQAHGQLRQVLTDLHQLRRDLAGLTLPHQEAGLQTGLQQLLERHHLRLETGLSTLASIGSAAPFIGLFGTVWGIYLALDGISQQQTAAITVVAGPMGEALLATAAGLFAAIPAVLAYNAFLRLNRVQAQAIRHVVERLQFTCLPPATNGDA